MRPDIFENVHKGIRKALFESCVAIGRAGEAPDRVDAARALARDTLRFVRHHGDNEDLLLFPLLAERSPAWFARMEAAHRDVEAALAALEAAVDTWTGAPDNDAVYHRFCAFVALYLEHMREEEAELQAVLEAVVSAEELAGFSRGSVARTAPADQRLMIGHMLPAMTRAHAEAFLGRVPPELAARLAPLVV